MNVFIDKLRRALSSVQIKMELMEEIINLVQQQRFEKMKDNNRIRNYGFKTLHRVAPTFAFRLNIPQ